MNEDMQKEVSEKIVWWIESSVEFMKNEIPEYVEQFIKYEYVYLTITLIFFLLSIFACVKLSLFCMKKMEPYEKGIENPFIIELGVFVPGLVCIFLIMGVFDKIGCLLQLYVAPKVYVVHHLTKLYKG